MMMALIRKAEVFTQTATFDHTYATAGTYTITITAQNSAGLTAMATTSVVVTSASTTTPGPVISDVAATSTTPDQAAIIWNTDESANSSVWFNSSSTVDTTLPANLTDSATTTSHSENLTGLTANTTYFYVVGSTNGTGVMSTSSVGSFVTSSTAASIPLNLTLGDNSESSTTVTVNWTTSPVIGGSSTLSVNDKTVATDHSLTVTGLAPDTQYLFAVESLDPTTGNSAVSAEFPLTTASQ